MTLVDNQIVKSRCREGDPRPGGIDHAGFVDAIVEVRIVRVPRRRIEAVFYLVILFGNQVFVFRFGIYAGDSLLPEPLRPWGQRDRLGLLPTAELPIHTDGFCVGGPDTEKGRVGTLKTGTKCGYHDSAPFCLLISFRNNPLLTTLVLERMRI